MGIYDRDYYREDRRGMLNSVIPEGGVCKFLIVAQIVVYLLQALDHTVGASLGLSLDGLLQGEIWRLFTFSFTHWNLGLFGLVFNLYFIWAFGSDLEQMYGAVEFACYYLVTTLLGAAVFLAGSYFQSTPDAMLFGTAGPITAITVLFAWHFPNHTIRLFMILPVPMWMMAVIEVVGSVYFGRAADRAWRPSENFGYFAYILSAAFLASIYYKKQFRFSGLFQGWSTWKSRVRPRAKLRVFKPEEDDEEDAVAVAAPKSTAPMLDEHLEAKVDAVLEKMARTGKEGLSESERQILLQASEIYRRKRASESPIR